MGGPKIDPEQFRLALDKEPQKPDRMLQFFVFEHLPLPLQEESKKFADLARDIAANYPQNPERTVCLRKLLEAKDAAVRTLLYKG